MKILIEIKNVEVDTVTMEDLFLIRGQLMMIDSGYQDTKLETPDWVIDKLTEVNREIDAKSRAELQRRLKAMKAREAALKPKAELRKDLQDEIAALERKLG